MRVRALIEGCARLIGISTEFSASKCANADLLNKLVEVL
jgi:hypothetical protein